MSRKQVCFTQYAEVFEFLPITDPAIKSRLYYSKQDLKWMRLEAKQSARNEKKAIENSDCRQQINNIPRKRRLHKQSSAVIDSIVQNQLYSSQQDLQYMKINAEQLTLTYLIARNRKIIMEQLEHQQRINKSSKKHANDLHLLNNDRLNKRIRLSNPILVR